MTCLSQKDYQGNNPMQGPMPLPHRKPFLFIDRIEDLDPPYKGTGYLTLDSSDHDHHALYDTNLILVEFSAQVSAFVAIYNNRRFNPDSKGYLVTIKDFTALDPYYNLVGTKEFITRVELKKRHQDFYRYSFFIKGHIMGELEFILEA